jgi:hypothetical protein
MVKTQSTADIDSNHTGTSAAATLEDKDSGTGTGDEVGENAAEAVIVEAGNKALAAEAIEDSITAVIEASPYAAEVGKKRKGGRNKAAVEEWKGKGGVQSANKVLDSGEGVKFIPSTDKAGVSDFYRQKLTDPDLGTPKNCRFLFSIVARLRGNS